MGKNKKIRNNSRKYFEQNVMKMQYDKACWVRLTQREKSESSKLTYQSRCKETAKREPVTEKADTRKENPAKSQLSSERCLIRKAPRKEDGEQAIGDEWGVKGNMTRYKKYRGLPGRYSWKSIWKLKLTSLLNSLKTRCVGEQREVWASPDLSLCQPRSTQSQVTSQRILPNFQRCSTSLRFHKGVFQLPFQSRCHLVTVELTWALMEMLKNNLVHESLQEEKTVRAASLGACIHQPVTPLKKRNAGLLSGKT